MVATTGIPRTQASIARGSLTRDLVRFFPEGDTVLHTQHRSPAHVDADAPEPPDPEHTEWHYGTHMRMTRIEGVVSKLPHTLARYYFVGGPTWLVEGGKEFFVTHSDLRVPSRALPVHRGHLEVRADSCLQREGALNLRQFNLHSRDSGDRDDAGCPEALGERLLWRIVDAVGDADVLAALRSWYRTADIYRSDPRHQGPLPRRQAVRSRGTRLRGLRKWHLPANREAFDTVYLERHGGRYEHPREEVQDDFGDTMESSAEFSIGTVVTGFVDHLLDFDYFRFEPEEGQQYVIRYEHQDPTTTLAIYHQENDYSYTRASYGLYENYGEVLVRVDPLSAAELPPVWVAPATKTFYVAIQNFGGSPGAYTFSLAPFAPEENETTSEPAEPPAEPPPEAVGMGRYEGTLDGPGDAHYWRFAASANRSYRFDIEHHDGQAFRVHLFDGEGGWLETWISGEFEFVRAISLSFEWAPPSPGDYQVLVDGAGEANVSYTLVISEDGN